MNALHKITGIVAFTFLFVPVGFSQVDYHWDQHGIGFMAPDDFMEETNNYEEFSAHNDNVYLSIIPWQDEYIDHDHLASALLEITLEMNYDELTDADEMFLDYFEGYYVQGVKDGTNAFIAALLDTESSTNMILVIAFNDGYVDEAASILMSIYA